jgi:hypothetical protein
MQGQPLRGGVAQLYSFNADPDPAINFNALIEPQLSE